MTLSDDRLRKRLRHPFKYFDSVDSSNDIAKAWLLDGAPEMAAVIADEQVRGRGRRGRIWHTPANQALALSVILRPQAEALAGVNMLGALSVYDLASATGCEGVGIKWPNDVQVEGKKVSGVLSEAVWRGKRLQGVVLGIGVNVRNDFKGTALEGTAISLEAASGMRLDRAAC